MDTQNGTSEIDTALADRRVCSACVGEKFLRARIVDSGEQAKCFYCDQEGRTFSIDDMADEIECAFEDHFHKTPTEPSSLEYAMNGSDYCWLREGEPVAYVVASAAELDEAPAADICEVLAERHYDMELAKMNEECPFDSDSHYVEKGINDVEYFEQWKYFEDSLKREARFFSRTAEATLASVFEDLDGHRTMDGQAVILEAGPGKEIASIFRARVFQSDERLEAALKRPDLEVGPPPSVAVPAGRMNARGISVFYGATTDAIAVAEVRPPVGSRVVVGQFDLVRSVRLLNLDGLRSVTVAGSIFDRGYIRRLERAAFLERLSHLLTRPVMPDDEPFDYLVTQAVADYLATIAEIPLDGIVYPSAQSADGNLNIVLFHKASLVEPLELPPDTEITATLCSWTDEGAEVDYWVSETVPPPESTKEDKGFDVADFLSFSADDPKGKFDTREVTLRLNVASIKVHHVQGIVLSTVDYPVHRLRSVKREYKF